MEWKTEILIVSYYHPVYTTLYSYFQKPKYVEDEYMYEDEPANDGYGFMRDQCEFITLNSKV